MPGIWLQIASYQIVEMLSVSDLLLFLEGGRFRVIFRRLSATEPVAGSSILASMAVSDRLFKLQVFWLLLISIHIRVGPAGRRPIFHYLKGLALTVRAHPGPWKSICSAKRRVFAKVVTETLHQIVGRLGSPRLSPRRSCTPHRGA